MKKNKIVNLLLAGAMVLGMAGSSGMAVYAEDDPVENPTGNVDGNTNPENNEEQSNGNENSTPNVTFRNSGPENLLGNNNGDSNDPSGTTTYTITYDAGNHGTNAPESQTKNAGEDIVLSDQKPSGKAISGYTEVHVADDYDEIDTTDLAYVESTQWTFDHWVSGEGDDAVEYTPGATYTVDADLALTAVYTSVSNNTKPTLPTATKAGYTLEGWYTEENGQGDFCGNAGEEIADLLNRPTVIYPKWVEESSDPADPVIEEANLISGPEIWQIRKDMRAAAYRHDDKLSFMRSNDRPADGVAYRDISAEGDERVILWLDAENQTFYWYSDATTVYMNPDSSSMFRNAAPDGHISGGLGSIDLTGLDSSKVTDMNYMFQGDALLEGIDLSGLDTSNVTDMSYMFNGCSKLASLDLSSFDTANVTNMSNMFFNCKALASLDLSSFNTANVTDMSYMFSGCESLTAVDVSGFDTSKVTTMGHMFDATGLVSLDLANFNTSNVIDMNSMFSGSKALKAVNVSSFDTSNVRLMNSMFRNCRSLEGLDVTNFKTGVYPRTTTNISHMFDGCASIESLDVSNFTTKTINTMDYVFANMTSLKVLNLEKWECAASDGMFKNCPSLETIWVTRKWNPESSATDIFTGDTSLVGIKGTAYDAEHNDGDYAHIDEGTSNPGYLSMVTYTIHYVNELKPESVPEDQSKDPGVGINISDYVPEGNITVSRKDVQIYPDYDTISKANIYFIKTVTDKFSEWWDPDTGYKFKPGERCNVDMDLTLKANYSQTTQAENIVLPYAEKDGYRLMGWYTEANGQGEFIGYAGATWEYTDIVPSVIYPYWVPETQATTIKVETYLDDELYTGDDFTFEIRNQATNELLGVISHFENGIGETGIVVSNFEDTTVVIKQVAGDNEMMNYDMNSFTKVIEKKA